MTLQNIRALVQADLGDVDAVIRARLKSAVPLIDQVAEHIISGGGKRLRPLLVVLAARACHIKGEAHIEAAAFIEFIHTATLLHDDVVDGSSLRRGRDTANRVFGNQASVLVGDFVYSRAFQMMVEAGSMRVMSILADATNRIAEGEVLQLLNIHDPTVDEERYLRVVERKTATLFEAAARIGAVIAGADAATEARCLRYGASVGTAFQIVDDILDYSGHAEELGKRLGDDLREGKVTLPIIYALRDATTRQRELIEGAIRDGGGDFLEIARVVHETGALEFSRARAEEEARAARTAASSLPASEFRLSLLDLIDLAIRRDR